MLKLLPLLIIGYIVNNASADPMIEIFKWKQIDFYNRGTSQQQPNKRPGGNPNVYPSTGGRPSAIVFPDQLPQRQPSTYRYKRGLTSRDDPLTKTESRWNSNILSQSNNSSYIPENNVPMGATHFRGRLFITVPRRRVGIPSTLNYIDLSKDGKNPSPKLHAYPNYETNYLNPNHQPNSNRIISVYRTHVDACKRLWFVDTGMLEYPNNRIQVQPPSIWILDLNTDRVLRRFEIPVSVVSTGRGLASVTPDVQPNQCDTAYAYLPDLLNSRLYVYSFRDNRIWTFSHNYFNFDPLGGDLNVGDQTFRWDDAIFSVTLGPYMPNGYRKVFFHAMASTNEFSVSSEVLQNEVNAERDDHGNDFQLLGTRGTRRQSTMHDYDALTGVLFYAEIQRDAIGCWNTKKQFSAENHGTVSQDHQRMIYPSDLTIDEKGDIWVMSNSLPIFIYSDLDPNVYNFRVWKQNVFNAVRNTVCQ